MSSLSLLSRTNTGRALGKHRAHALSVSCLLPSVPWLPHGPFLPQRSSWGLTQPSPNPQRDTAPHGGWRGGRGAAGGIQAPPAPTSYPCAATLLQLSLANHRPRVRFNDKTEGAF